jgi:hypothetical protein
LRLFNWTEDPETRTIDVENAPKYDPATAQRRPAILVAFSQMTTGSLSLNNRANPHFDTSGDFRGTDYYATLEGRNELYAVGALPMEALQLAEECFFRLLEHTQMFIDDLELSAFRVSAMGNVTKRDEPKEHYIVPFTVEWGCVHGWTTTAISPILKRMEYTTEAKP